MLSVLRTVVNHHPLAKCGCRINIRAIHQTLPKTKKYNPVKEDNLRRKKKESFWQKFDHFFEGKPYLQELPPAQREKTTMLYVVSLWILTVGLSYAAVPLYRIYCQKTGYGGTTQKGHDTEKVENMKAKKDRVLTIKFNADTAATMQWNFKPQQAEVSLYAGETALAFYTARNPTPKPIDGISTYNVVPFEAGQYFNKIQCFCFEEQRLNPNEEVDMPVFFYIDPEYLEDPYLEKTDTITLSYTFFESKPGLVLPQP